MVIDTQHDGRQRRCPRLGHILAFSYCRQCEGGGPCAKLCDCWWEMFDIRTFVCDNYPDPTRRHLLTARPAPKVNQLLALIAAAKERTRET